MVYDIKNGSSSIPLLFLLVQSADHITALTGASPTVTISKNGAAFASPSGAVTEIGSGWYKVAGNATDTNTNGPLALHATATSGDPTDLIVANIVAYDPTVATNLGLSGIPTANPGAANGIFIAGTNVATTISSSSGSALTLTSSGSNGNGINITGNGTGAGIKATAGATGHGIQTIGGATSGDGINSVATTSGHGITVTGVGTTKHGINATGGATTSAGISATGGATSGDGIIVSATSGHGINTTGGGTTKHGISATGGATSSDGIRATGNGTGNGINAQSGSGATGDGILAVSNATAGNGATLTKAGTGKDLNATSTPLVLAKTTNITGFNDITAQAVWDALTSALTTVGSIGKLLVDNINATISSRLPTSSYAAPLDAAGTRSAIGMASANLDTQLATLTGYVDTEIFAIKAKTDNLPASPAATGDAMTLTSGERTAVADALLDRNMATGTDSGGRTMRNALRFLRNKFTISSGTLTVTKEDDSTTAWTSSVTTDEDALPIISSDPS